MSGHSSAERSGAVASAMADTSEGSNPVQDDSQLRTGSTSLRARWHRFEEKGLVMTLIVMMLCIGIPNHAFFNLASIVSILRQASLVAIISFGMVFLISMIELDLSVGGIYAMAATISALLIKSSGFDPWTAVLIALGVSTLLGATNGIVANLIQVPVIIVSLGSLPLFVGITLTISNAQPIIGMPEGHSFFQLFGGDWFGLPAAFWTMVVAGIGLHVLFIHSRFGTAVRAVGSNTQAAFFTGIRVSRVRVGVTALVGFLSGLSGVLTLAFFKSTDPTVGHGLELQVIAAAVIGGTSLAGGSGTILGAVLGVLIISTINSGIVFFGIDSNYAELITGLVILIAISLDRILKRKRGA